MNRINLLKSVLVMFLFISIPTHAGAIEFKFGKKFFDYGNGAINLDRVTYIDHEITYRITWSGDPVEEFSKEYGPLAATQDNISSTLDLLDVDNLNNGTLFYYVEIYSSIKFDNFDLTILPKERYLKLPELEKWDSIPEELGFGDFIESIAEVLEIPVEEILDTELEELKAEDFSRIEEGLNETLEIYKNIVR